MAASSSDLAASEATPRGQQIDLFVESLVSAPLRDDRATMEFPFFALQKRPLLTPILYKDGNVSIRISPGERGIATIWDKDVLIYLSSLINAKIERGEEVSRTVRIAAYDMVRAPAYWQERLLGNLRRAVPAALDHNHHRHPVGRRARDAWLRLDRQLSHPD